MFGSFAALGAKVVGIPRLADGPDIARLAELAALHKPKLYIINSVLHNPSSTSLSAAKAFQVLRLAEEHDFLIVEDDIYCDLHPGSAVQPATRLAALDQLQRVIYLGGFSKTMAANLRVGFIATSVERAEGWPTARCCHADHQRYRRAGGVQGAVRRLLPQARRPHARAAGRHARQDPAPDGARRPEGGRGAAGRHVRVGRCRRDTNVLTERAMAHNLCWRRAACFAGSCRPPACASTWRRCRTRPVWRFLESELDA
jgi:DNA-binding transcriptional MocR family regulator